jgi:hypothetical protein
MMCIYELGGFMPTLTPNITNRVRKLPKPSNATQGLQPVFEAVSNAFYAIEDRFGETGVERGRVAIDVEKLGDADSIQIVVADNGIGLDQDRYEAFCIIDTDFKFAKGGKGVGRLFWLDAFQNIRVDSRFEIDGKQQARSFRFILKNKDQIDPIGDADPILPLDNIGTAITFEGLRSGEYASHFPKRADTFLRYFSAHFIADFLVGSGPQVSVTINGETSHYPKEVADLVVGRAMESGPIEHEEFGTLIITGFACRQEASTGLDGMHQLHLLANGRTVETRKIDNLIGLTSLRQDGQDGLVFHGCVSGSYLDDRVNEGRTAFTLPESKLKEIARHCVDVVKEKLIPDQIAEFAESRRASYEAFVRRHPIYGFDEPQVQLDRVPFHATAAEDFAAGLVKYQIRREEGRQDALQEIIGLLEGADEVPTNFAQTVVEAAQEIHASEQLALAQHVVRRKLVLEILEKLLKRVRERADKEDDHHLEETLHSFICPMRLRGDDPTKMEARAHDLWIVDERFAFTRAFASDMRLDQVLKEGGTAQRPDVVLWNLAFGMGIVDPDKNPNLADTSEPLKKVLVVEFKRPGRKKYDKAEDNIEAQITKYLAQLQGGEIESFDRERIRIADDCVFHCYVVADIVGDLELQLSAWDTTANGQGRIRPLKNKYRGAIEVVQWRDLVNEAWARNAATLYAAGLSRSIPTKVV